MELVLKHYVNEVYVPDDADYIEEVRDILENEVFQQLADYPQHGSTSCLSHSIAVSYLSYRACKKRGWNARAAARGGLLHDLFLYDWHFHYQNTGKFFHGLTHPRQALINAEKEFHLTELEREIILKHMWPLTVVPPRHRETYVVLWFDKVCSLRETFNKPVFMDYPCGSET